MCSEWRCLKTNWNHIFLQYHPRWILVSYNCNYCNSVENYFDSTSLYIKTIFLYDRLLRSQPWCTCVYGILGQDGVQSFWENGHERNTFQFKQIEDKLRNIFKFNVTIVKNPFFKNFNIYIRYSYYIDICTYKQNPSCPIRANI